ncbi:hypothetical protein F4801DRAFT_570554 [Xylaria longipes]|nr:hypothetical protein F4801DRAFT_570554 [Xylaria longipes]
MNPTSSLPSSPWAERFPIPDLTIIEGETKHSLLAPQNPSIKDPKYYYQDPDPKRHHGPDNNKDIDKFLWSEALQKQHLLGVRTYQLAVLNRRLMFSTGTSLQSMPRRISRLSRLFSSFHISRPPGSHTPARLRKSSKSRKSFRSLIDPQRQDSQIYERERIKVDEKSWLPFLRKDRWFDWINFSLSDNKQPRPRRTWSVDDEEVWEALSVSLELANRILQALLNDRHDGLRTMIYGRWDFWSNLTDIFGDEPSEGATVLLSYSKEQEICKKRGTGICEFEQSVKKTVEEARDRLIKLFSNLVWSFADHQEAAYGVTNEQPSDGSENNPYSSLITLHVGLLEAILDPDLTEGELCILQVQATITIIHELMHAILNSRFHDDNYVGNRVTEGDDFYELEDGEPYIDAEGFREAGFCMEQSIFGGASFTLPSPDQRIHNIPYAIDLAL